MGPRREEGDVETDPTALLAANDLNQINLPTTPIYVYCRMAGKAIKGLDAPAYLWYANTIYRRLAASPPRATSIPRLSPFPNTTTRKLWIDLYREE